MLLGPPGAGKGTQAHLLQDMFEACQVSTGDILRKAVAEKSALGQTAAGYLNSGTLVPDDIILKLVAERLKRQDCAKGFVLDGFPRTIAQADGLQAILKELGLQLDHVLSIQVPRRVIVDRLSGRRTCSQCGAMYHTIFNPAVAADRCDRCGGQLLQREDDREETVTARLNVYENQTAPLVDYYRQRDLLREIDGVGTVEEIGRRVLASLGEVGR